MTKKLFYGLLAALCICLSGSMHGMKRKNSTTLIICNPKYQSLWLPSEVWIKIAGYCWPKEKNTLMRLNKQCCECIKNRTAIMYENPSTVALSDKPEVMIEHAYLGDTNMMRFLLAKDVRANRQNIVGTSPLHVASDNKQEKAMQLLVEHGADVNDFEPNIHPLHKAAYKGDIEETVRLLLDLKTDPNLFLDNGDTALMLALENGHTDIVKLLLANGRIDINQANKKGRTALILASENGYIDVVKLLLDYGANVQHEDNDGNTALCVAVEYKMTDIVELLFDHVTEKDKKNALLNAVDLVDRDMVALLLKKGVDINCMDDDGRSALAHASHDGNIEAVKLLLDHGVDINCVIEYEQETSALLLAVEYGYTDIVELLLAKGADVKYIDNDGWNALSFAAYYDRVTAVKLLLAKGVNIHQKITDDFDMEVIKGDTPLQIAQKLEHTKIVALIKEHLQREAKKTGLKKKRSC